MSKNPSIDWARSAFIAWLEEAISDHHRGCFEDSVNNYQKLDNIGSWGKESFISLWQRDH